MSNIVGVRKRGWTVITPARLEGNVLTFAAGNSRPIAEQDEILPGTAELEEEFQCMATGDLRDAVVEDEPRGVIPRGMRPFTDHDYEAFAGAEPDGDLPPLVGEFSGGLVIIDKSGVEVEYFLGEDLTDAPISVFRRELSMREGIGLVSGLELDRFDWLRDTLELLGFQRIL